MSNYQKQLEQLKQQIYGQQQTPSFLGNVVAKYPSSSRGTHYGQQPTPSLTGDVVANYPFSSSGSHYGQRQTQSQIGDAVTYYPFPSRDTSITDEDLIQKYIDENKQLILMILEKQKGGKLHECAIYREKLRANLKVLADIGNAQHFSLAGRKQVRTASTMQAQHHDSGQLLQSILPNRPLQQQIQLTQPSILRQTNMGTPLAYMQTASRNPTDLLHHISCPPHQHQQFLHGASPNSGYMSTGTCTTSQFDTQTTESDSLTSQFDMQTTGSDSLNISSGRFQYNNRSGRVRISRPG